MKSRHLPAFIQIQRPIIGTNHRERNAMRRQLLERIRDHPPNDLCPEALPPPLLDEGDAHAEVSIFLTFVVELQVPHPPVFVTAGAIIQDQLFAA
jgi:hypothetical protein